jgi:AraC-like DNA-binding protein
MSCSVPKYRCVAVPFGRLRRSKRIFLPRHQHPHGYATLVLAGGFEETGDRGRFRVRAGDILLHEAFESHLDRCGPRDSEVLNLGPVCFVEPFSVVMQVADPDSIARLAERSPQEALELLLGIMRPSNRAESDWPDQLAEALQCDPHLALHDWARTHNLSDATVSRGFEKVYGISPSGYRAQCKARLAWRGSVKGSEPFPALALDSGFSDQAHMTRGVRALTGKTPGVWRRIGQVDSRQG